MSSYYSRKYENSSDQVHTVHVAILYKILRHSSTFQAIQCYW